MRSSIIEKNLSILEIIGNSNKQLSAKDLSNLSEIPLSSIYKTLNTLTSMGYLKRYSKSNTYSLGYKLLFLGNQARNQLTLVNKVRPLLEKLTKKTKLTSNLVIEDEMQALYIERVNSQGMSTITNIIGKKAPLHATGVGKCFLAWRSIEEVIKIIDKTGMVKLAPNTITNLNDLLLELRKVREKGYALDLEECEEGIRCISSPILIENKVIAAISITGSSIVITDEKLDEYSSILKSIGEEIIYALKKGSDEKNIDI